MVRHTCRILVALILSFSLHFQAFGVDTAQAPVNNALVPVPKLENDFYDWYKRHDAVKELIKTVKPEVVFLGDSITHLFGGEPKEPRARGQKVWTEYYGKRNAINLGFGWDRTQNVLWRLENGEFEGVSPKVVVILIGTNNLAGTKNARSNTPAEIAEGVAAVCDKIHALSPKSRILLLGVLPRGKNASDGNRKLIAQINEGIAPLGKKEHITYLDLGPKFLAEDGTIPQELMGDYLHPTEKGYEVWAKAMEPTLKKLLDEKSEK